MKAKRLAFDILNLRSRAGHSGQEIPRVVEDVQAICVELTVDLRVDQKTETMHAHIQGRQGKSEVHVAHRLYQRSTRV